MEKKERYSNFELLRILAMAIIVIHHLCVHGIEEVLINNDKLWMTADLLNIIFLRFFRPGGALGVGIFFMISGYFMYNKKPKLEKSLDMIGEVFFYSIICILFFLLIAFFNYRIQGIGKSTLISFIFPIGWTTWWFFSVYLFLYLITPGINYWLDSFDKRKSFISILIFLIFFVFVGSCFNEPYVSIQKGIFYYFLGMTIKKYDICGKKIKNILCFFIFYILAFSVYLVTFFLEKSNTVTSIKYINMIECLSDGFLVPLACYYCFLIFKSIKIGNNFFINRISSHMFAVYLIHASPYGISLIWNLFNVKKYYYNYSLVIFSLYSIIITLIIILVSVLFDEFRILLIKKMRRR